MHSWRKAVFVGKLGVSVVEQFSVCEYTINLHQCLNSFRFIRDMLEANRGREVVREIIEMMQRPGTQSRRSGIFALVLCIRLITFSGDKKQDQDKLKVKHDGYAALRTVCKTPSDLANFLSFSKNLKLSTKGFGRGLKKALCQWYLCRSAQDFAYVSTKYVERRGWKHKDLFKLCHINSNDPGEA